MSWLSPSRGSLIVLFAVVLSSCANPDRDWQRATQADTTEAYDAFVRRHPNSPFADEARAGIERIAFEEAAGVGTIEALQSFLNRFDDGALASRALTQLERLEFDRARQGSSVDSWKVFLQSHSDGELAASARQELEALEFGLAAEVATSEAWRQFLNRYPGSSYAAEARDSLARLEYVVVREENTIEAYERFLSAHANSVVAANAKKRHDELEDARDWRKARSTDTRQAYLAYLKAHPQTTRMDVKKGEAIFRVIPPSAQHGMTRTFGGDGEPGIEVEAVGWTFTHSLTSARALGLIDDGFARGAAQRFAGADARGGLDPATGRFLLYYAKTKIDSVVVVMRNRSDPSVPDKVQTDLVAILNDDMTPISVSLETVQ